MSFRWRGESVLSVLLSVTNMEVSNYKSSRCHSNFLPADASLILLLLFVLVFFSDVGLLQDDFTTLPTLLFIVSVRFCMSSLLLQLYVHISLYTYAHMIPVSPSCYCRWSCWWQIFNFPVAIIYIVYPCLCCILLVDRHSLTLGLAVQPVSASKTLIPFCWQRWAHSFELLVTTEAYLCRLLLG